MRRGRTAGRRVLVIGGGAAGLAAGAALARRAEVVLVEARDRLGGRIDTRVDPVLGLALDLGAEFVHGRPPRTLALAREAGARVRAVPDRHRRRQGAALAEAGGDQAAAGALLGLGTRDDQAFGALVRAEERAGRCTATAAALARDFVQGFYLADPRTASALALARMTQGLEAIGGEALGRVEGGYARVLEPLRRELSRAGAEVRLGTRVEELRWARGRVEVRARGAAGGRLPPIRAAQAVITVPLPLLRRGGLRFRPALPEKERAAAALEMGPVVKVLLRFRRAPWPDAGPRALAFLHVPGAPFPALWTRAPAREPVLVAWAGGPDARRLAARAAPAVARAALGAAARGLGRPAAALEGQLEAAAVVDWARDPLAGGGYAVFPVGAGWAPAALARSVEGTLFFAGEAIAGGLAGTVEGALQSGERAAAEALVSAR